MLTLRSLRALAVLIPISMIPTASAWACPGGGGRGDVVVDDTEDRVETLLVAAREAEANARSQDMMAKNQANMAMRQREMARNLRERARLNPEEDREILLAKAVVADKEAQAAEARARKASMKAQAFRDRAAELRAEARRLMGRGDRVI